MASIKPYYTSNSLIEAVKRKMSFPIAQVTFSEQEILDFANEEMFLEQVPSIMQYHEEYFVYIQEQKLLPSTSKYPIPGRAIGMKLRDLFFKDTGGQLVEMSRISPDDKAFFEINSNVNPTPVYYYIQNNNIIIVPSVTQTSVGTLVFSYFMRPNVLVPDSRAAVCSSFSKNITIDNDTLLTGDKIVVGGVTFEAGVQFQIGVNSSITAGNLSTAILLAGISSVIGSTVNSNIISLSYSDRNLKITTHNSAAIGIQSGITVNTIATPEDFVDGMIVDLLQMEGGHVTLGCDIKLGGDSVSATSIIFEESQLSQDFIVGDYICAQYECIVPQIPTDLHNLLAERTCSRIMEALGDKEGQAAADAKIARLEQKTTMIIDTRVDGAPQKVLNKNGFLRSRRVGFGRRF